MADARETVIVTYLSAMEHGDLDAVCACFTAGAKINSPVYGDVPVRAFYERLFADTVRVEVEVQNIYCAPAQPNRWAAHFTYKWCRKSGNAVETDLVDLFGFEGDLIANLRIVFDSRPKVA